MKLINNDDDTKISLSIEDLTFYGATFQQLKDSKMKYSVWNFISKFYKI